MDKYTSKNCVVVSPEDPILSALSEQRTLSLIIPRVCEVISTVLVSYITCPSSEEAWLEIAKRFHSRWQLPNCIRAIDRKHVRSYTPQELAPIILITKGSSALCLWQSWALMQNLCLLMLAAKVALVMVEF